MKKRAGYEHAVTAALIVAALLAGGCVAYGPPAGVDKVLVCHKNKKTLSLPESAVDGHLGHGDTLGPCF